MQELVFSTCFAVFAALALTETLLFRRLSPSDKKRIYPRLALLNAVVVGAMMLAILASWGYWAVVPPMLLFLSLVGYLSTTRVRICASCGSIAQPQSLTTPAKFCSKCGTPLSASPLLARRF